MMPHDSSKSGNTKLPVPYKNGHSMQVASTTLSGGGQYSEGEAGAAANAPAEASDVSLFRALRRCWLSALVLGLLAGGAVGGAAWYVWPARFTAQALVHVPPRPGTVGEDLQQHVRTQSAQFKARKVIEGALRTEEVVRLSMVRDEVDPATLVEKGLQVDANLGPEILRVSLSGDRPEELRLILDAMVKVFVKEAGLTEQGNFQAKLELLQGKKREYENQLREKRSTLQGLEDRYGADALQTPTQRRELHNQQLAALRRDLTQTQVDLKVAAIELAALTSKDPTEALNALLDAAVDDYLKQDARFQLLQTDLVKLEQDVARVREIAAAQLLQTELERFAGRRAVLQKAIEERRKDVRPTVERLTRARALEGARDNRTKMEARKAGLEERERQLQAQIERQQAAAKEPGRRVPEVDAVRDAISSLESGLKKVNEQIDGLKIDTLPSTRASVLEPASLPKTKNTDRQLKMAGVAGLGAFGLLFAGVLWREIRTRRVYGATEVVSRLGANLLGTLPVLPARARSTLPAPAGQPPHEWQERFGESVDAIRTQLLHSSQTEGLKIVMVTSAVGGEGKTSLATHLAASLARAWRKTLLIDGDLRKPAVHTQFDQAADPGFCDVLRGDLEFSEVIQPTPVSRLWIAPAGQWDAHALQALAQDTVRKLFEGLREQYDFIIVDSSPVLPVADTLSLGQHVDGVIFAVLRDVSRFPAIQAAQQRLAALDIRQVGTVVIGANDDLETLVSSAGYRARASA